MADDETRVAAIRQRAEAATGGPGAKWTMEERIIANAIAAREDVPWLLDRLRAAEAELLELHNHFGIQEGRTRDATDRAAAAEVRAAEAEAVIAEAKAWVEHEKFETGVDDPPVNEVWNVVGSDELERILGGDRPAILARVKAEAAAEALVAASADCLPDDPDACNWLRARAAEIREQVK